VPFTAPPEQLRRTAAVLADVWPGVRAAAPTDVVDLAGAVV
jgi:hypothetical protein